MKKDGHKIILVEPSDIIYFGIRELLKPHRIEIINHYKNFTHFKENFCGKCDGIIVDSLCLRVEEHSDIKQLMSKYNIASSFVLDKGGNDSSAFINYNGVLSLCDTEESFTRKIVSVLCSNEEETFTEHNELTDREIDVLANVAKGKTNKEIAQLLNISVHTVMTHRKNISKKTRITSGPGLTVYAIINKYVDISDLS